VPTYQYTCTECGEPVEAVQKFTDAPLTACSACGGRLRKVFSPVGIVFKGSGFYRTDSRKSATASDAAKEKQSADSGSTSTSTSTSTESSSGSGNGSGNGSADKPAAKKPAETVSAAAKSSSSRSSSGEKVA
jgi:putative FmdB family regulatory protein